MYFCPSEGQIIFPVHVTIMSAASPTRHSLKGIISKMQPLLVLQMPPSDAERQNILFLYQC